MHLQNALYGKVSKTFASQNFLYIEQEFDLGKQLVKSSTRWLLWKFYIIHVSEKVAARVMDSYAL